MNKSDARARYTEHILKESLLAILREKPVNRITVKEVCERAEINRATFYAHYRDCFDLEDQIEEELLEAFSKALSQAEDNVGSHIEAIYGMIRENEEACRVLIFSGARPSILGRMILMAKEGSLARWRRMLPDASDAELEMLYIHLSHGLMNVVVGEYDRYSKDEVEAFVRRIVKGSLALFQVKGSPVS